jgi:hypothetical protein
MSREEQRWADPLSVHLRLEGPVGAPSAPRLTMADLEERRSVAAEDHLFLIIG